jgi:hypothetical protein
VLQMSVNKLFHVQSFLVFSLFKFQLVIYHFYPVIIIWISCQDQSDNFEILVILFIVFFNARIHLICNLYYFVLKLDKYNIV